MTIYSSSSTGEYCVYLTTYLGNKMPMFYIGSSSAKRVHSGYHGSVRSIRYSTIWKQELSTNPHLFKTQIISLHDTRKQALERECKFQRSLGVVKSTMYLNESLATVNGFFGLRNAGENHPLYGQPRSRSTRLKISKNHRNRKGSYNTNAKTFVVVSPTGIITRCFGTFKLTCQQMGLAYSTMNRIIKKRIFPDFGSCVGYDAYVEEVTRIGVTPLVH